MPAMKFPRTMTSGKFKGRTFETINDYQKALRVKNNGGPKKRKPAAKRIPARKPTKLTVAKRGAVPKTSVSITIDFSLLGQQFQIDGTNDALVDQALREASAVVDTLILIEKRK